MEKARWAYVDNDAALALATRLINLGSTEISALCADMKTRAAQVEEITGTMNLNVQLAKYFNEASDVFASTAEGIEAAGKLLQGSVLQSIDFVEQTARQTLI